MSPHELDVLLFDRAQRAPEAVAIDAGALRLTYGALAARARKLSGWLRGVGAQGRLAILSERPALTVPALLACMDAGWTYAPLDPGWPQARLEATLDELSPDALWLPAGADAARLLAAAPRHLRLEEADALPDGEPARARNAGAANVFFTSGTTGRPKGILGRPGAATRYVTWEARLLGLQEGARVSALAPTSFDASLRDALLPLLVGGTICAPEDRAILADGARLGAWLDAARVHVLHTVPTVFRGLLAAAPALPWLQAALLAGEPLRPSDVARFLSLFGDRIALYNLYGPTEATMTRLYHRVTAQDANSPSVPLGRPMDDTEVFIIDSAGQPRGAGRPGEIALRTPWAALGYLNRPEETARAFVPDLLGDGDPTPVYRTGDVGLLREDGLVEFRGRRDLQVKIRGVRVELEEVEAALGAIQGVEAAVAALRDGPDDLPRLVAWIVGAVDPARAQEEAARALPAAAVPSQIVSLAALPRLLNGKVDRAALQLPARRAAGGAPPQGETERRVAQVLQEVLGGELGATDDVFTLGMSSLQALQALWRLNALFAVELPIDLLYRARTVRALGEALDATAPSARTDLFSQVTLRDGEGLATFWLPPAYGLTLIYWDALARLSGGGPHLGLDLPQPVEVDLEELAAAALAQIRRAQPQGPYRLAGWSLGGVLAFAIARQLGHAQVERLILLDSAAPGAPFDFEAGDAETAALVARRLGHMFGVAMHLDAEAARGQRAEALCEQVLTLAAAHQIPIPEAVRARAREVVQVREAMMRAWRGYQPAPYEGPAWIARAGEAPLDWTQGWDALITGEKTRRVLGGTHVGMFGEAHLDGLRAFLEEALGEPTRTS